MLTYKFFHLLSAKTGNSALYFVYFLIAALVNFVIDVCAAAAIDLVLKRSWLVFKQSQQ